MDKRQAYYSALNALFESTGWQVLEDDMQNQIDAARDGAFLAADMHELGRLRGRAEAFIEIRALPAIIAQHEAELLEDDDADL
jgi:hypothetical protein